MTGARSPRGWAAVAPVGAAAALFVALWAVTFRRWTDVVVDFGRELYVAWRISAGEVLGRDIEWFSGALSAHVNALVFRSAGASLLALELWNTALALAVFGLAFALVAKLTTRWTAAVVIGSAIAVFGFGQYGGIGNTNYITPYSHEPVHGLLLGALSIVAAQRPGRLARAAAGLLLAATFLTKAEPFVAACAGWIALHWRDAGVRRGLALRAAAFGAALAAAYAALRAALPPADAWQALVGPWRHMLGSEVIGAEFYAHLAGFDDPQRHATTTLLWTCAWAGAIAAAALLSRVLKGHSRSLPLAVIGTVAGLALIDIEDLLDVGRPTALATAVAALALRCRAEALAWCAFALAWLPKLGLRQSFVFYGFVHTLPAYCVLGASLWCGLAARLERSARGSAAPYRAVVAGLLLALSVAHVRATLFWRQFKTEPVGSAGDTLLADGRGDEVAAALAWLLENTQPHETVLVVPEGLTLNYWARRRTPTRYLGFMPTELEMFGEHAVIAALEQNPPATVVVVHKDTSDYGARFFGQDYGRDLAAWLAARYQPVVSFGATPFVDWRFGVVVMRPR